MLLRHSQHPNGERQMAKYNLKWKEAYCYKHPCNGFMPYEKKQCPHCALENYKMKVATLLTELFDSVPDEERIKVAKVSEKLGL